MDNQDLTKTGIIVTANSSSSTQNIELIQIDVEDENDPILGEPVPKTAKDLFSDFKASDESEYEFHDGSDSDSDLPLAKRTKTSKKKSTKKNAINEDGSTKKKVCHYPVELIHLSIQVFDFRKIMYKNIKKSGNQFQQ